MKAQHTLLIFIFCCCFYLSAVAQNWRPHIDFEGQIYISYILAVTPVSYTNASQISSEDYLGDPYGMVGVVLNNPPVNTSVQVSIDASKYSKKAEEHFRITSKQSRMGLFPKISWDYTLLRKLKQATPLDFTIRVTMNGKTTSQTVSATLRAIDDCPIAAIDYQGDTINLQWMMAAYINPGAAQIKEMMVGIKTQGILDGFVGLQQGFDAALGQLYALWSYLRKKRLTYSSINENGYSQQPDGRTISQRIRLIEDVFLESQFNCIEGTAFFASFLEAISIPATITLTPGHAFLGVYLGKEKSAPLFLETTLLDNEPLILPKQALANETVKKMRKSLYAQFNPQSKKGVRNTEIDHFLCAILAAHGTYEEKKSQARLIDVTDARKLVRPIYRDDAEVVSIVPQVKEEEPALAFKFMYEGKSFVSFDKDNFSSTAPVKKGSNFKVHVDFFSRSTDFHQYPSLKKYGRLDVEWVPNKKLYRLELGDFSDLDSAKKVASALRKIGYAHTSVVQYNNGNRVNIIALQL